MYIIASPFVVRLRRWYKDPRQWIFIAGMVTNLGPIALNSLGLLHLGDTQAFVVGLALNGAMNAAGAYINYQSTHVIGTKADVASADAVNPGPAP